MIQPVRYFQPSSFVFAFFVWALLLVRWGYQFGTNDHVELLPYMLYLADSSLYPYDFFIQNLAQIVPNERFLFASALTPFLEVARPLFLVLHCLSTLFMLVALELLGRKLVNSVWLVRGVIVLNFVFLYDWALGGVELYYSLFQASNLAKALATWALVLLFDKKYYIAVLLIAVSTYIQIIVGVSLMMVLGIYLLFLFFIRHEVSFVKLLKVNSVYVVLAIPFLLLILLSRSDMASVMSNAEYFDLLFRWRHPHHFILTEFPIRNLLFMGLISALGLWFVRKKNAHVTLWMSIVIALMLIYAFFVDVLQFIPVANFQLYKLSIWLKPLALFGVVSIAASYIPAFFQKKLINRIMLASSAVLAVLFLAIVALVPEKLPHHPQVHLNQDYLLQDEFDIYRQIEQNTPKDAVFIQPIHLSGFKFYAQRSSFVEFKANVRTKKAYEIWYPRIKQVYGINRFMKQKGFALNEFGNTFFHQFSPQKIRLLKEKGVTHILVERDKIVLTSEPFLANSSYEVYDLSALRISQPPSP